MIGNCDRQFLLKPYVVGDENEINREYLYDAYSERDHIPLAK